MDITTVISTYFQAWNEPDEQQRSTLAASALAEGARYVDPVADVEGPDGFASMVGAVHQMGRTAAPMTSSATAAPGERSS